VGLFGGSKSKSKTSKTKQTAGLDQITSDNARSLSLQNLKLSKGSRINIDNTSDESFAIARDILADAQTTGGTLVARSQDLAASNLERSAGLISDVGDLLGAGFESAIEFASASRDQSNRLAQSLSNPAGQVAPSAIAPTNGGKLSPGLAVAALAVLGVGFYFAGRR